MSELELLGARRVRELLARHDVRPTKTLGQNFVIDPNTIRKVADVAEVGRDDVVLEVGAGAGSLTVELARRARRVVAVEIDPKVVAALRDSVGVLEQVEIVHGDVLTLDLAAVDATKLVANLPYNIAAEVVITALERAPRLRSLTVMTQREVGERFAASPGSKAYGRSSVMIALYGRARVVSAVSRNAFYPVPKVDSVIVHVVRHRDASPPERVGELVKAAFAQRRKTIRNNLAEVFGSVEGAEEALTRAGVDPSARAEMLQADDFVRLAEVLP